MLRVPTHEELSRDALYVREALRVGASTPVGQIMSALRIPSEWAAPCVERALQYAFRLCYDAPLRERVLQQTAQSLVGAASDGVVEATHASEAYLLFELNAGVTAARLHDPPPVVPAGFRVPGTQLALLATRFLIWKTKQTSPHIQEPYHETLRFLRALKFHDASETLGAKFPRYHVFLAIVVTVVNHALDAFAASLSGSGSLSLGLLGLGAADERSGAHHARSASFFLNAPRNNKRDASSLLLSSSSGGEARGHRRCASDSSAVTVAVSRSQTGRPHHQQGEQGIKEDDDGEDDLDLSAFSENISAEGTSPTTTITTASSSSEPTKTAASEATSDESSQHQEHPLMATETTTSAASQPQQQEAVMVTVRLAEFKLQASASNADAPLEVRSLLEKTSLAPKVAAYVESYVPMGLMLGALTADGEIKPFRAGVDEEAWATPPAEVQPLRFRVAVYAQSSPNKLADRTLVARYTNGMTAWPTVRDPYRLDALNDKMRDHVRTVFGIGTGLGVDGDVQGHKCAVFASTSALNSTAVTSDPASPLSHQIISILVRLAKTDPDFEGKCHVKIYVPDQLVTSVVEVSPQQAVDRTPVVVVAAQQQQQQQQVHPLLQQPQRVAVPQPPPRPGHAHHPSLPNHPLFQNNYENSPPPRDHSRQKRVRLSGDLPPLAPQHTRHASHTSITVPVGPPVDVPVVAPVDGPPGDDDVSPADDFATDALRLANNYDFDNIADADSFGFENLSDISDLVGDLAPPPRLQQVQ
mmetsp:Transcript_19548/g.60399  ORF Transcript_19548/g.60399 Transcript_19548/m.60399 type:complete len:757 (-) Transcript_19548:1422-3692(-)